MWLRGQRPGLRARERWRRVILSGKLAGEAKGNQRISGRATAYSFRNARISELLQI